MTFSVVAFPNMHLVLLHRRILLASLPCPYLFAFGSKRPQRIREVGVCPSSRPEISALEHTRNHRRRRQHDGHGVPLVACAVIGTEHGVFDAVSDLFSFSQKVAVATATLET